MSSTAGLPLLNPEPGHASGYRRDCGEYGRGTFDDIRTSLTGWITHHEYLATLDGVADSSHDPTLKVSSPCVWPKGTPPA